MINYIQGTKQDEKGRRSGDRKRKRVEGETIEVKQMWKIMK